MNFTLPLGSFSSTKRTTFLSEGVKLCGLVSAVCVAPLPFVPTWIAIWLLSIFTIVALGTFAVWAINAIKNKSVYDSEEHTEHMTALAMLGQNREGMAPLVKVIDQALLGANPEAGSSDQEKHDG